MQQSPDSILRESPPWNLRGRGWILLYRFKRDFLAQHAHIPEAMLERFAGGIGSVMLVDYTSSPIGPYRELLFVPGRFKWGRRRFYSVTRIYVSTQVSVVNGRENWGIPKEQADFHVEAVDTRTTRFAAAIGDDIIFDATLTEGILRFPVNTRVNPFPAKLAQTHADGRVLVTTPQSGGVIGPAASLDEITVDGRYFPDVSGQKPIGVIQAVNFRLYFPVPYELE